VPIDRCCRKKRSFVHEAEMTVKTVPQCIVPARTLVTFVSYVAVFPAKDSTSSSSCFFSFFSLKCIFVDVIFPRCSQIPQCSEIHISASMQVILNYVRTSYVAIVLLLQSNDNVNKRRSIFTKLALYFLRSEHRADATKASKCVTAIEH
jgi:hypothetical protein